MVDGLNSTRGGTGIVPNDAPTAASLAKAWFGREILPLEAALMQYLEHNWRNASDITDLRQEIYARVFSAALQSIPERPKQYLFVTAKNILINRMRREQVVPIEAAADLDALEIEAEEPGPDRIVIARDELRRLQAALVRLPARAREAFTLGRIEGLARPEIAARMGISEIAVSQYLTQSIRELADILYSEPRNVRRKP